MTDQNLDEWKFLQGGVPAFDPAPVIDPETQAQGMLDQIAEIQSQVTLLTMDEKRVLETVAVPDEIAALQKQLNERMTAIEQHKNNQIGLVDEEEKLRLAAVKIPPEIQAAFDAVEVEREKVRSEFNQRRVKIAEEADRQRFILSNDTGNKVAAAMRLVETKRSEIQAEFSGKRKQAQDNAEKLTTDVKTAVVAIGHTVKGQFLSAVFNKGRVTWNTDILDGLIIAIPELAKARKEGAPFVTIKGK